MLQNKKFPFPSKFQFKLLMCYVAYSQYIKSWCGYFHIFKSAVLSEGTVLFLFFL